MRRKVKLSRILILILIPILIVSGSVYVIYMLFTQEESVIEEKSYYDLNLFSLENGLMTYKDSLYKVSTGIDVSSHNGAVDWAAVKTDGIEFAMLRIGYRGAQEGILHEDEYFNTNIQQAIQNHLKVGAYFFSSAISAEEIDEEVDLVLIRSASSIIASFSSSSFCRSKRLVLPSSFCCNSSCCVADCCSNSGFCNTVCSGISFWISSFFKISENCCLCFIKYCFNISFFVCNKYPP